MRLPVYNLEGKKTGKTVTLKPEIFGLEPDPLLIQSAFLAQSSKSRKPLAHTKTRAERRGGGAKPWRQKGTGRARAGSRRSPIWRKGGVTFGPRRERNFIKKINRKARRKVILMILSDRAQSRDIVIIEELKLSHGKTKEILALISKLPLKDKPLILFVQKNEKLKRAARNLPKVKVLSTQSLNVIDLLSQNSILLPQEGLEAIAKTYS